MLEEMENTEEILDCVDLIQGNEYYIKLHFNEYNVKDAIQFSERFNGVYKLIEIIPIKDVDNNRCFYKLINENNMLLSVYFTKYGFICDISSVYRWFLFRTCECKIYKINNTEYVLK